MLVLSLQPGPKEVGAPFAPNTSAYRRLKTLMGIEPTDLCEFYHVFPAFAAARSFNEIAVRLSESDVLNAIKKHNTILVTNNGIMAYFCASLKNFYTPCNVELDIVHRFISVPEMSDLNRHWNSAHAVADAITFFGKLLDGSL